MIVEEPVIELLTVEILTHVGGFILKESKLGVDDLGDPAVDTQWRPYLGKAISCEIHRGGRVEGLVDRIEVGTLTLTLRNFGDPAAGEPIRPKSPIRVRSLAGVAIFTGAVEDLDTRYFWDRRLGAVGSITTIVATDPVSAANNRSVVPRLDDSGSTTWEQRITGLGRELTVPAELPNLSAGGGISKSSYRLSNIELEATIGEHFTLASVSAAAVWWAGKDGVLRFATLGQLAAGVPIATFSDHSGGGRLVYREPTTGYNTRSIVNDLEVRNTSAGVEETFRRQDLTGMATWGPRSSSVELNVYDEYTFDGDLGRRVDELLAGRGDPRPEITGLVWNAQDNPAKAAELDIYSRIVVEFGELDQDSRILGIDHSITPGRWLVTLTLRGN